MKKTFFILYFSFYILHSTFSAAQCAMCKRAAETSFQQQKTGQNKGRSLNNGILYLLSVPYIIGAVGVIAWYKRKRLNSDSSD
jgi:hypothetical protein